MARDALRKDHCGGASGEAGELAVLAALRCVSPAILAFSRNPASEGTMPLRAANAPPDAYQISDHQAKLRCR